MVYDQNNWFHSRVASSNIEIRSIVKLVEVSKGYPNLRWSGKKTDPKNIDFANEIGVNASQMQTKIRAFMRFGFIKEGSFCPLEWTKMGEIWRSLVINAGDTLKQYTDGIQELILASSLTLYSFDSTGFTNNPVNNYRPIKELFQKLNAQGFISTNDLHNLIGEQNKSYWITDLKNSGILEETTGGFKLTSKFPQLFQAITSVPLPTSLSDDEWKKIQNDVLDLKNPYNGAILKEMESITSRVFNIEGALPLIQKEIVEKMVDYTNTEELKEIEEGDYTSKDEYSQVKVRRKQSAWSDTVRKDYGYKCCVPKCDVGPNEFLQASHIKKYSEREEGGGHRANPRNGLSLCPLCHIMFEKGYFTITGDLKIKVSTKISNITSSRLKDVITASAGLEIKKPTKFLPTKEFIDYHQNHVFLN